MTTGLAMLLWFAAFAAFLCQAWYGKTPVAGLALCYWLNLASEHLLTEVLCLFHRNLSMYRAASEYGFPLTGYAMLGLMVGNLVLARPLDRLLGARVGDRQPPRAAGPQGRPTAAGTMDPPRPRPAGLMPSRDPAAEARFALAAIIFGGVLFLVGGFFKIPSLNAVTFGGNMLATGGFACWWWTAYRRGRNLAAVGILAASLVIPFLILTFHGFLGFGVASVLPLLALLLVHLRARTSLLIAAPALYLGLSVGVTYLNGRGDIRRAVWIEQANVSDRVDVIDRVFTNGWLWFDPTNDLQREYLDARLDQNYFVGRAAQRIDNREMDYARGETFVNALVALVPRVLWREKPEFAGGSAIMARFTGLSFAGGVSFGIGHVLEGYANYGPAGLVVYFIVLGAAIGVIDARAGRHLRTGRYEAFLLWFVPGQALLNGPVDSFADVAGEFAGFLVLAWVFVLVFRKATRPTPVQAPVGFR